MLRLLFWHSDLTATKPPKPSGLEAVPPTPLRYRVWGEMDIDRFAWGGKHCKRDIDNALEKTGKAVSNYSNILDFGCGCGRVFMFMTNDLKDNNFFGTDIDKDAIDWCRKSFPAYDFKVNNHRPPLDYPSNFFDLVLSVAVFRHLNEADQFIWLQELQRVMEPGGILLLSLHGQFLWKDFPDEERAVLEKEGFLFKQLQDPYHRTIFPEWYQATYHSREYVMKHYVKYFEIVDYISRGVENETDLVICRKAII
ncbi:MAG: methyltransferase domain-containing protein [Magnetococcales bacterium]|nr:methyltransferase domain-containing protein [Magnetococcales bacterium]